MSVTPESNNVTGRIADFNSVTPYFNYVEIEDTGIVLGKIFAEIQGNDASQELVVFTLSDTEIDNPQIKPFTFLGVEYEFATIDLTYFDNE